MPRARVCWEIRVPTVNDSGVEGPAANFDGYTLPRAWSEGLIARGRGEMDAAERAFAVAQRMVEADLAQWPDDPKAMALMGLVHAALRGEKRRRFTLGRRAVEFLPISKDAYDGPLLATKLAVIYAQVGELDLALELLAGLVTTPNGPTAGTLAGGTGMGAAARRRALREVDECSGCRVVVRGCVNKAVILSRADGEGPLDTICVTRRKSRLSHRIRQLYPAGA